MAHIFLDLLLTVAGQHPSAGNLTGVDSLIDFLAPYLEQLLVGVLLDPCGFWNSWRRLLGRQEDDPDKAAE